MARLSSLSWRTWSELLGSMRFAIASLSILAIASVIGTLLRQREPYANYVNQFGPFWAEQLRAAGVYEVYNAWWFLLVLAFLVVSTSLCVLRNTPKFLRDMRAWREHIRVGSLRAFHHRGEQPLAGDPTAAAPAAVAALGRLGYKVKVDARAEGTMVAAKRGAANRLGYIFAHVGIVVICVGGLLDSELPLRTMVSLLDKAPLPSSVGTLSQVPASALMASSNPSWRGNVFLPEGGTAEVAVLNYRDGMLLQDLPFRVELKHFRIEFYSTGMPKLFASDVELVDKATGKRRAATIEVNKPLIQDGIAIYQSSFDDGGSKLKLRAVPVNGSTRGFEVDTEVGGSVPLTNVAAGAGAAGAAGAAAAGGGGAVGAAGVAAAGAPPLRLEITGFRSVNVENLARAGAEAEDAQQRKFRDSVASVLSPSGDARGRKLQNVGPSVQYKLRDASGQAREFNVYANPMEIDGASLFLAGVRETPDEPFRYLRIPADDKGTMGEWLRLRAALADAAARERAAQRYARLAAPRAPAGAEPGEAGAAADPLGAERLAAAAGRSLELFSTGGLQSIAEFIDANIPEAERERAADALLKVLGGALWELWQVAREREGLPPAQGNVDNGRFLVLAQNALSDAFLFGAPVFFELTDFREIRASVLQMTRAPGQAVVYLGCLLLVLGVFAMFYVRERRVWCWLGRTPEGAPHALYAMSSTRQTLDLDREFETLRTALASSLSSPQLGSTAPPAGSTRGAVR